MCTLRFVLLLFVAACSHRTATQHEAGVPRTTLRTTPTDAATPLVLPEPPTPPTQRAGDDRCLIDLGCAPPASVSPCPRDLHAQTIESFLAARASLVGRNVTVQGPLVREATTCTMVGCLPALEGVGGVRHQRRPSARSRIPQPRTWVQTTPNGPDVRCCVNTCESALVLGVQREALDTSRTLPLRSDTGVFTCRGDDSAVCCPLDAHGQTVVVQGTYDGSALLVRGLCVL